MTLKVVVHESEGGGYWAEVPAMPGCATQANTIDQLMPRLREAVEGWLSLDPSTIGDSVVFLWT
jgi:predicted RNase H-like HicB family nuclease